jgi:hypothetical protein
MSLNEIIVANGIDKSRWCFLLQLNRTLWFASLCACGCSWKLRVCIEFYVVYLQYMIKFIKCIIPWRCCCCCCFFLFSPLTEIVTHVVLYHEDRINNFSDDVHADRVWHNMMILCTRRPSRTLYCIHNRIHICIVCT